MDVEWDSDKASSNAQKHDVEFDEAATVVLDPFALAREDEDSAREARWVIIGRSSKLRLLTVVYTIRNEEALRIISARKATRKEAKYYA